MTETEADRAAWTIKSMSVEVREMAVVAARKRGETMGQWLERAVRNQANLEAGDKVILPDERPGLTERETQAIPVIPASRTVLIPDIGVLAHASGLPVPKDVARHAFALAREQLRAARGLPPVKPRQTRRIGGQTIAGDAVLSDAAE